MSQFIMQDPGLHKMTESRVPLGVWSADRGNWCWKGKYHESGPATWKITSAPNPTPCQQLLIQGNAVDLRHCVAPQRRFAYGKRS